MVKDYIELSRLIKNADYNSIVLGSSHGEYGIKAEVLSNGSNKYLNCATISQDLYRSYNLIKNISLIKEIKTIIMTYSLFSNGFILEKTRNGIKDCYLSDVFLNIKTRSAYNKQDAYTINLIQKYAKTYPAVTNRHRNIFGDKIDEYSFMENIDVKERVSGHIKHNKRNSDENVYIEKIIHYCKANSIKLIIIVMPVRADYISEVNKYGHYKSHYKNIIEITSQNNIPLLLYDNKVMDYNDFGDFDHLTEQGAYKFSKVLKNDVCSV